MKLENQVVSLELAKKMKKLWFKQDSLWYWGCPRWNKEQDNGHLYLREEMLECITHHGEEFAPIYYSAYTVAELGVMLPVRIDYKKPNGTICKAVYCEDKHFLLIEECESGEGFRVWHCDKRENTEANARAKMLIWLKENNYL